MPVGRMLGETVRAVRSPARDRRSLRCGGPHRRGRGGAGVGSAVSCSSAAAPAASFWSRCGDEPFLEDAVELDRRRVELVQRPEPGIPRDDVCRRLMERE
jgi:hypothetical protein